MMIKLLVMKKVAVKKFKYSIHIKIPTTNLRFVSTKAFATNFSASVIRKRIGCAIKTLFL